MSNTKLQPKPHNPIPGRVRSVSQIQRDEHVGFNEATRRHDIEKSDMKPVQFTTETPKLQKTYNRDPITGRFKKNDEPAPVINIVTPSSSSELEKFANKNIGTAKDVKPVSKRTKKSIERVITNIVNIASTMEGVDALLNKTHKNDLPENNLPELFGLEDLHVSPHTKNKSTTNTPNIVQATEQIKQAEALIPTNHHENKILEKIEEHTASTAEILKQVKQDEKKAKTTEKIEDIEKKAKKRSEDVGKVAKKRSEDVGKVAKEPKRKKADEGFFEGIKNNVVSSPGGKLVQTIGSLFKRKVSAPVTGEVAEGGGSLIAGLVARAAPAVLIAGIAGLVLKGLYDRLQENKKAAALGIEPEGTDENYIPESEQPLPDSVKKRIEQFEGPNKSLGDFSKLSKVDQEEAFKASGSDGNAVPDADMKKYFRKQELEKLAEKDEPTGTSIIGGTSARGAQHLYNPGSGKFIAQIGPGLGGHGMQQNIMDPNISTEGKALLETIASKESGGDYNIREGGSQVSDLSQFPQGFGRGGISSASGKYQFVKGTWEEAAQALGLKDFSPESQDKAAWWLAQRDYNRHTGGNLAIDIKSKDPNKQLQIGEALHNTWTSLPGGFDPGLGHGGRSADEYLATLNQNTRKYTKLEQPNTTGTQMAQMTNENAKLQNGVNQPPPIVIQSPPNIKSPTTITDVFPNVRDDDPTILQALRDDIKQA